MAEEIAAFGGPYRVEQAPRAMLRFAIGSAATIATLLCIPDGIGIMPDVPNALSWFVRVPGLWLSAYILWIFGFLLMLFFMRKLSGGIEIHEQGLKLWRLGKLIRWDSIKAVICEPQPFFSRAFFLPTVYRVTLYQEKGAGKKKHLAAQNIASFQFSQAQFTSLFVFLSQHCFNVTPSDLQALILMPEEQPALKKTYEQGKKMRVFVSVIILLSLVSFLGRKAASNFAFNSGTHHFRMEDYPAAEKDYAMATKIDPMFPPSWDRLARSQSRQGKFKEAEKHWHRALELKPDYVEAKIGLSLIAMNNRDYDSARRLLQSALRLSPSNVVAYLNLARLQTLTNHPEDARSILQRLLELDPQNIRAHALLGQIYLQEGKVAEAQHAMAGCHLNQPDVGVMDANFFNAINKQIQSAASSGDKSKSLESGTKRDQ